MGPILEIQLYIWEGPFNASQAPVEETRCQYNEVSEAYELYWVSEINIVLSIYKGVFSSLLGNLLFGLKKLKKVKNMEKD